MTTAFTQMAENAPNNWTVFNNLSKGVSTALEVACGAGGTIVVDADLYKLATLLKLTGAPGAGFQVDVPNGERWLAVWNDTGQTATIDTIGNAAAPPTVVAAAKKLFWIDSWDDFSFSVTSA